MTAVLLGINENRLAHFKAEKGIYFIFFSFMGGPYVSSGSSEEHPTPPQCAAHSGCHYHARVNGLQLMRPLRAAARPAQAELLPLALCHRELASGEEQRQQSSEGTAKNN